MASGFVLVILVLVLGGVIATAGDRIGMRVGKARLSLFRLRPRQTATLITILTGSVISAATLGLLFAVSEQLRTGVFRLRSIQEDLSEAQTDLEQVQGQKQRIEEALADTRAEQEVVEERLETTNRSLRNALNRQEQTEAELAQTQTELSQIEENFQQAEEQLRQVTNQKDELSAEIAELQAERRRIIAQQEAEIARREMEIIQQEAEIASKEEQLQMLESQRSVLTQEVQALERELQALREGNVVLLNNQLLAVGVVRVSDSLSAPQAVDQLLRQANRNVLQAVLPGTQPADTQVIQITNAEVEELIQQISDGQDYVVQVLSGGNYLVGEPCVLAGQPCIQVAIEAVPNQVVFSEGEVIAAATVNPTLLTSDQLVDRLELLLAAAQFRARQAGVVRDTVQVPDDQEQRLSDFFEQLRNYEPSESGSLSIQAIAANDIYTVGPLSIELAAIKDGTVIFSTVQGLSDE
ncbi:MAG: DUF3084 domain-containing protein [Elainellaceae cyanobacterium]